MRFPRYLKESSFCDGCAKEESKCPLQTQKDNMISGLTINSCSDWLSKTPIKPRPSPFQDYNYKRITQQFHLGKDGLAECGINQSRMGVEIKISNNPKETTCLRCKKTYEWKRMQQLEKLTKQKI